MLTVDRVADLEPHLCQALGTSDWLTVDQRMIDGFADATGDHQWIHVDPARAAAELPGGRTIAHGFLTLSLLPRLMAEIYTVRRRSRAFNYGSDKVRFVTPVPSGGRIRLHATLRRLEPASGGTRIGVEATMELEDAPKPALVAEIITLVFD